METPWATVAGTAVGERTGPLDQCGPHPLPVPLHTFAGADDRLVTVPEMAEWSRYTSRESGTAVPGGHFFIREQETAFLDRLSDVLGRYAEAAGLMGMNLVGATGD